MGTTKVLAIDNDIVAYEKACCDKEIFKAFGRIENACKKHALHCQLCFVKIIDGEGNPGYGSEACAIGAALLALYNKREAAVLNLLDHTGRN